MDRWVGKTAVVTGASAGIGAAVCLSLARAGMRVVGLARREHLVDDLKAQVSGKGDIYSHHCDVADPVDVAGVFRWIEEEFRGVHVLVNNAGILRTGHITVAGGSTICDDDIISTLDTDLKGPILCTRHAVKSMIKQQFQGHIIHINSITGHYDAFSSDLNVYPLAKRGISSFTMALLNEFADSKTNIKVTSLSPGVVQTDLSTDVLARPRPALLPQDIADAVLYVVSTPPNVNVSELTISAVTEKRL